MGMAAESQFHVLAVDDSRLDRMLIARLLKKASYHVTTVDSGAEALEFLGVKQDFDDNDPDALTSSKNHQELEVNLILTDYCMPGMTGYDLLKKIKESSSLRDIPVAIMSSENVPSRITECLEEGAEDFFLKPVKESDLNKLKPQMIRTRLKNQVHERIEKPEKFDEADSGKNEIMSRLDEADSGKPEIMSKQEQEQEQRKQQEQLGSNKRARMEEGSSHMMRTKLKNQIDEKTEKPEFEAADSAKPEISSRQEHDQEQEPVNNKRKTMEEGLTQDRSRRRYDEITTFV